MTHSILEILFWWALITASFPFSYYVFGVRVADRKASYRRVKLCSVYLVGSFISYVMWLLTFRPTNNIADLSPFGGFLLAVIFPWVVAVKRRA